MDALLHDREMKCGLERGPYTALVEIHGVVYLVRNAKYSSVVRIMDSVVRIIGYWYW